MELTISAARQVCPYLLTMGVIVLSLFGIVLPRLRDWATNQFVFSLADSSPAPTFLTCWAYLFSRRFSRAAGWICVPYGLGIALALWYPFHSTIAVIAYVTTLTCTAYTILVATFMGVYTLRQALN
jgi:hypothetical protein